VQCRCQYGEAAERRTARRIEEEAEDVEGEEQVGEDFSI